MNNQSQDLTEMMMVTAPPPASGELVVKKKIKLRLKVKPSQPVVVDIAPPVIVASSCSSCSIWVLPEMRHRAKHQQWRDEPAPVKMGWPAEDISDDEANEEGELESRQHFVEKFRMNFQRSEYEDKLYGLQMAGLFLNW